MKMLKIISFKICPFVQRVTAALNAKNIPYKIEYISLKNKPQWFLGIAPNGQVPVLITESGTALFESDAIIEYIEDEFGAIDPQITNEQRAKDRAWSYLATKNYLLQCGTMGSKEETVFKQKSAKLIAEFAKVEQQLSTDSKFFKSNNLSNVDIAWLPLLHRAAIVKAHTGFDFLCCLPKMQKWQTSLLDSGAVKHTTSDDFEALFIDFYLTNTYLGNGEKELSANDCNQVHCC